MTSFPLSRNPSPTSQSSSQASPPAEQQPAKKKRGRLSREQLAQLEHLFAVDCSPTVPRRREIALLIGISERQIQVWFQNRRAKAKNNGEKCQTRARVPSPVKEPPKLREAVQTDLAALIQEDDPTVFAIPCTTLTIGGWNRVNYEDQQDLLAWICEKKRCFTWFVHSKDYSFKMQVSLDSLKEMAFRNAGPGKAFLTIDLSEPPTFFLRRNVTRQDSAPLPCWRQCDDWTEHKIATHTLRHVLGGPVQPLANVVTYVKNQMADTKPVSLHPINTPADNHHPTPTLTPPSTKPTYPSPRMDDSFYFPPVNRQPVQRGWNSAPCPVQPPLYENTPKAVPDSFHSYTESPVGNPSMRSMGGYSDAHSISVHDKMGFMPGMNGMGNTSSVSHRATPLLDRSAYPLSHYQSPSYVPQQEYQATIPLPGFSELFSTSRDSR
ncbi:Homeobox protein 10 [Leucoagaricus sp. SymC.cos]|nr:Homeobox protein 10 [Leucoagaricus sp. SymC.cos]